MSVVEFGRGAERPGEHPGGVLRGMVDLLALPLGASESQVMRATLALALRATGSEIGFLHHLNPDLRTLEVGVGADDGHEVDLAWERYLAIPSVGWGTAVWKGGPHVENEARWTGRLPGFPATAHTRRFLGLTSLDGSGGLLLGLANAPHRYSARDAYLAADVLQAGHRVLGRIREHAAAVDELDLLSEQVADMRASTWRWDPDDDSVTWGVGIGTLLGIDLPALLPPTWAVLEDHLEPFSRYGLRQARGDLGEGQPLELELWTRDREGQQVKLHMRGRWVPRPQGTGAVMHGTLTDITAQEHAQRARDRATRDQLTGLTNRAGLIADLNRRIVAGHQRVEDQFALHMLDLNRFKQVNDTHGHLAGDAVLRATAARLRATVRRDDMVARLGGDEFVIVQSHCTTHDRARALAMRVAAAVTRPINDRGLALEVATSIGVAFSDPARPLVRELLARADDALYAAKRSGGGLHLAPTTVPDAELIPLTRSGPAPAPASMARRRTDGPARRLGERDTSVRPH